MGSSNVTLTMDLWALRVALWMVNDLDNFFQAMISFLFESQCHVIALGPHGCRHHIEVRPRLAPQQVRPSVALENPWPVSLEEEREAASSWSSSPHGLLHLSTPLTHLHPFSYAVHGTVPSVFKAQKLYFVAKTRCTSVSCKCTCVRMQLARDVWPSYFTRTNAEKSNCRLDLWWNHQNWMIYILNFCIVWII